jgi:hypothetical protein
MFLDDNYFDIKIFYKKSGRHYIVYDETRFKDISEEEKTKYTELNIKANEMTWGLYNDLQESAMVTDNLGNRKWNYKKYKENKLRAIIAKWDAKIKNNEGKEIIAPVNPDTISKLSPDIAEEILNLYDKMTLIDEDEEKNS